MTTTQSTVDMERPKNTLGSCIHHWLIDAPEGPVSQGVCLTCGEQREFTNSLDPDTRKPPGSL